MKLRKDEETALDNITREVIAGINQAKLEPYVLGHGFLWGVVTIERKFKNGKTKVFMVKHLFCSFCAADHNAVLKIARSVPGVTRAWINLD